MAPTATTVAALVNPTNPNNETISRNFQAAARTLGLQLQIFNASAEREIDAAFAALVQLRAGSLVISTDVFLNGRHEQIIALARRHAVPAIYQQRFAVVDGGLMSYAGNAMEAYDQAGIYTGRVLKGERPADLPVQQSTKVELIINLKTAKALGLTVPQTLLGRADEVIE
jgi:putative ABC transport system substrate-binding protein